MASTNKFPTDLNKWQGTDKPKREDFVEDNRILSNDAMWKKHYDKSGEVLAAEGIVNFVHAYVGDQLSVISSDNRFSVYTHEKTDNIHQLIAADAVGDNIKFVATENFNTGDLIYIDNTLVTAVTPDGALLGNGAFKSGSIVICFRNNDTFTFDVNNILSTGGAFTGDITAHNQDSTTKSLRNIQIQDSVGTPVSTNHLVFRR